MSTVSETPATEKIKKNALPGPKSSQGNLQANKTRDVLTQIAGHPGHSLTEKQQKRVGGQILYTPPPLKNKKPSGGGRIKQGGGGYKIPAAGGLQNIHPPPLPSKNAFWAKTGEGGVAFAISPWKRCLA